MVIADTGFWIALANAKDVFHQRAIALAQELGREGFVCTWPVITETVYLMGKRIGMEARLRFMAQLERGVCSIHPLPDTAIARMHFLMRKYHERRMDLADASLIVLAEELGTGLILSSDKGDFETYRWKSRKPFKNLLLTD